LRLDGVLGKPALTGLNRKNDREDAMQKKWRWGPAGFTLLELMMGMLLVAVLITLGAGSLKPLWEKYQLQAQAEDLLSTLLLARGEALKRGVRVTACVSRDGIQCESFGDWDQGWLVFEDADSNATRSALESLVQAHGVLPLNLLASGNGPVAHYVSYGANGRSLYASGAFQAGTITLCRSSAEPGTGWKLVINAVGRPRLEKVSLAACP
jgi:type IV fimbrial biogenesis protein FimT